MCKQRTRRTCLAVVNLHKVVGRDQLSRTKFSLTRSRGWSPLDLTARRGVLVECQEQKKVED